MRFHNPSGCCSEGWDGCLGCCILGASRRDNCFVNEPLFVWWNIIGVKEQRLSKLLQAQKLSFLQYNTNLTRSWKFPISMQPCLYKSSLQAMKWKMAKLAFPPRTVNLNFLLHVMCGRCSCHLGPCMHADPRHSQSDDLNLEIRGRGSRVEMQSASSAILDHRGFGRFWRQLTL